MKWWTTLGLDLIVVLLFATIGRLSHGEAADPLGILTTAWPFVIALAGVTVALIGMQRKLGIDRHATRLDFKVERDGGMPIPVEAIVTAMAEIDGSRQEIKLCRRRNEVGQIAVALKPQERNQIRRIEQSKFGSDWADGFREDGFARLGIGALLHQVFKPFGFAVARHKPGE